MQICLFWLLLRLFVRPVTKLAIDWEADTAIEESVLRSIGNPRLKPIFRSVAEIQRCFVSSPRVCSGQHVHNAWQRYWQHIAGTTWRPTGPNALRFATTSCVAPALLACPWFLVFDLYVRHATCTWCRYRPRQETYGTRACVHGKTKTA